MAGSLMPPAATSYQAWANRVRAHGEAPVRAGLERNRKETWASAVDAFTADPRRDDEPALDALLRLVQPGETWLDIGAGAGRYALPLALAGASVVAIEPSTAMAGALRAGAAKHGVEGLRVIEREWPMAGPPAAGVALIAHVGYGTESIGPFLDAMEAAARRLCVALMLARAPSSAADAYWLPVHGVERPSLPALPEFLRVLLARGKLFDLRLLPRFEQARRDPAADLRFLRRHLRVEAGTPADERLQREYETRVARGESLHPSDVPLGIVTWEPGQASES
ncbi:hypothetical protein EDM76_01120 [bacterium]|nr:MAG: hypothetical protein EDM76_01120 [bacterium]